MKDPNFRLDFVGIGVPKSGTSWFYQCLQEHPQVCCSIPKELHFFNKNHGFHKPDAPWHYKTKGWEWHKGHFQHCAQGQLIGEVDPLYIYDKEGLRIIRDNFPNVKIIISLRNPVERAYSFYRHIKSKERYSNLFSSFEEALEKEPELKEWGLYSKYIKDCYDIFPKENVLILVYDDLKENPLKFIQKIYGFLGVNKDFIPNNLNRKINVGILRMSPISKVLQKLYIVLDGSKLGRTTWEILKKMGLRKKYIDKFVLKIKTPPEMKEETRISLKNFYKMDIEKTEKLIGRRLDVWR